MHFFTKAKRITAFFSAASFALSALSVSLSAYATLGTPLYSTSLELSRNLNYSTQTAYHETNGLENAYILEYQPGGAVSPVVAYGTKIYGRSDIKEVSSYIESTGKNVVGGINGDFFELSSGVPIGLVVTDGILRSSDAYQSAVGFYANGSAVIGNPNLAMSVYSNSTGKFIPVLYMNKERTSRGVYLFTEDFSAQTHVSTKGVNVILQKLENKDPKIGDTVMLSVVKVSESSESLPISAGQMILTADSKAPAELTSALLALVPGENLIFSVNPADSRFKDISYGVGGGNILVEDGKEVSGLNNSLYPHSAIGLKADGSVILFAVDGRQQGYSAGLSLPDLARHMIDLGCISAINMDGGGSTTTGVVFPGNTDLAIANSPSDGTLRKCADYILLVNSKKPTKTPKKLYIYPYDIAMLAGTSVPITVKAVDSNYYPSLLPYKLSYGLPKSLGYVKDGRFFAGAKANSGALTVNAARVSSGKANIEVFDKVDALTLHLSGKTESLNSIALKPGELINLDVSAYFNKRALLCDESQFSFSVTSSVGTVNANGLLKAADMIGASGTVAVSYNGFSVSVPVLVGKTPELFDNFDSNLNLWAASPKENGLISASNDYVYVKYGLGALSLSYDFIAGNKTVQSTKAEKITRITVSPSAGAMALKGKPNYLNVWVYGDGSGNLISLQTKDASGNILPPSAGSALDFTGYRELTFPLPAGSSALSGILLDSDGRSTKTAGTIYFDQMIASFDTAFSDITSPVAEIKSFPIFCDNNSMITASVTDAGGYSLNSLKVNLILDGKKIDFSFDGVSGAITSAAPELSAGMHRLTLTASDVSGNYANTSVAFVMGTLPKTAFADMQDHWASPYVDFLAGKKVITGELKSKQYYYSPERNTTRLDTAVLVSKYLGLDPEACVDVVLPYADLAQIPAWALPFVKAMYKSGLMIGISSKGKIYFNPGSNITRMEAMTILGRTLPQGCQKTENVFSDAAQIASWAKPHVENLAALGIVSGYPDGSIKPVNDLKRSEIASMLFKLY